MNRLRGWRVGRSFNCENRLLGRGARSRRRSICLPDGPCVLGNCVSLRLFTNLFLLLFILRQDGNEIVRDRLFKLQLKVRSVRHPGQKSDGGNHLERLTELDEIRGPLITFSSEDGLLLLSEPLLLTTDEVTESRNDSITGGLHPG